MEKPTLLDCTLRDGGYYNAWDFDAELVRDYIAAMAAARIDVVELGMRFAETKGFKGPFGYTTDHFLRSLDLPEDMRISVMLNGADLLREEGLIPTLERLFPEDAKTSPVSVVRIACHVHEMERALPAANWLKDAGFVVGFNLMQVADRSRDEVAGVARLASGYPIDVLYFADSMGSMTPEHTARIIDWLRDGWSGPLGIHTHDNMGLALQNTLRAQAEGATWLDSTVTGMGRGPGNARTEELVIEAGEEEANLVPLLSLVRRKMQPMKELHGWGTNPYYFLAGKYGIHPTYVQEMASDPRYDEEDVLAVIDYLRQEGGKKYSSDSLAAARTFFRGEARGSWNPADMIEGRDVLIIGAGPGAKRHRLAIEDYVRRMKPVVIALNTQETIGEEMIDLRAACHPVRLLADASHHRELPQPLVAPVSMMPEALANAMADKPTFDFGVSVEADEFLFGDTHCTIPASLVVAYALAIAASGRAESVHLAGFDGYAPGDRRNAEMEAMLSLFAQQKNAPPVTAVTPTSYAGLAVGSIYGMQDA